ncbi:hypothetical protein EG327_006739 [Venturia inaequalis]|uniref:Uncharacterized protein n=1 Tax=Venturia inaequalis TaxID=5025 RepID=A0A8H3VV58_VENIN|nr:hypothetical protein EG327_006739 [Venturia inaequalis]
MDRQNPFQRHRFFLPEFPTGSRQPAQPIPVHQPPDNPFRQGSRITYRRTYEREDIRYSETHHPSIELQPVHRRRRSNDAQFQASPRRPSDSRQSTTLETSSDRLSAADQGYALERQNIRAPVMGQHRSATRARSRRHSSPARTIYIPTDREIFDAIFPPTSWVGPVMPRNPIPYPIPRMRNYRNFNDAFHKFLIKGSRSRLIERLNTIAAEDSKTRGFFPDTGLVSIESITHDFCAAEYILIYCDHLVEPTLFNGKLVFASTFGIVGKDKRTGQWHVRCWIQPSDRILREIQYMVREKVVVAAGVVPKAEARGGGFSGQMKMQEHEEIWTLIQGWDREMRGKWAERFQAEGGGPTELYGEAYYELKGRRWEG